MNATSMFRQFFPERRNQQLRRLVVRERGFSRSRTLSISRYFTFQGGSRFRRVFPASRRSICFGVHRKNVHARADITSRCVVQSACGDVCQHISKNIAGAQFHGFNVYGYCHHLIYISISSPCPFCLRIMQSRWGIGFQDVILACCCPCFLSFH